MKTAYRNARVQFPLLPASHALAIARQELRFATIKLPQHAGDSVRIDLPRGESITLELKADHDGRDDYGYSIERDDLARETRNNGAPLGWMDRTGRVLEWDGRGYRWWVSDYTPAEDSVYLRRRMSRHTAWLTARERTRAAYRYAEDARESGYLGYVATLYDAAGKEVDSGSCWGFEDSGDYAAREGYDAAMVLAESRAAWWTETDAREVKEFRITWTIDLDAANPQEAAALALQTLQDPDSRARAFQVADTRTGGTAEVSLRAGGK